MKRPYKSIVYIIYLTLLISTPLIADTNKNVTIGKKVISMVAGKKIKFARNIISKTKEHKPGIYSFRSNTKGMRKGLPYIGKSVDTVRRLKEHLRTTKLPIKNVKKIVVHYFPKNKIHNVEKNTIKYYDYLTKGGLANKQHAPMSRVRHKTYGLLSTLKNKLKKP